MILIETTEQGEEADQCETYSAERGERVVIETPFGQVFIDVRQNDVNAFTLTGLRKDFLLIAPHQSLDRSV